MADTGKSKKSRKKTPTKFKKLEPKLMVAFNESALPGENIGFDQAACREAALFVL